MVLVVLEGSVHPCLMMCWWGWWCWRGEGCTSLPYDVLVGLVVLEGGGVYIEYICVALPP